MPLLLLSLALHWVTQTSNTTASLRGLCTVSPLIVWASGTQGTFLRTTDGGLHWQTATVPGAEKLDFRDIEAFNSQTAILLSSGDGPASRIYKTTDAGLHWQLVLTNPDPQGFFDDLAFWDPQHGILIGDPVNGHFVIYTTNDGGNSWQRQPAAPEARPDEGVFAASGTSLIAKNHNRAWIATGGPQGARILYTLNSGESWQVANAPLGGSKTAGIFSLAFFDLQHGIALGGDYKNPQAPEKTVALTHDAGKTWSPVTGLGFRSGVAYLSKARIISVGTTGSDLSLDSGRTWQHFSDINLNAVASMNGSVFAGGPKGVIVKLTEKP